MILKGICSEATWLTGSIGTSHQVPGSTGAYGYLHRRSDDYFCAFFNGNALLRYFIPGASGGLNGVEYGEVEEEGGEGTLKAIHVTRIVSDETTSFNHQWAGITGSYSNNDSRISYSLSTSVSTMNFLPAVPERRLEFSSLSVVGIYGGSSSISWSFAPPLPLKFSFSFEGGTYTTRAIIPFTGNPFDPTYLGRWVHSPTFYNQPPNGQNAMCAADGALFSTLAEEMAHNSLAFTLSGGATSRTFNQTASEVVFESDYETHALPYSSNSEVGGAGSGRAFFPAIVRINAAFTDGGRLHVDISDSVSPTAQVVGCYVEGGATGTGQPSVIPFIDHYEVSGVTYDGPYIPSPVFDIVFDDGGTATPGYLTLWAVVDADALPATAEGAGSSFPSGPNYDTLLELNYRMSIPAALYVNAMSVGSARFIVRPSGEIKERPKSLLWQHPGSARIWAGEIATGKVLKSDDEGETYDEMAQPWEDTPGAKELDFDSLGDAGAMSIADVGGTVNFRRSADGMQWESPVPVTPYTGGAWCVREHRASDEGRITLKKFNGIRLQSDGSGDIGTWEEVA